MYMMTRKGAPYISTASSCSVLDPE